jgi:hypothetical protein
MDMDRPTINYRFVRINQVDTYQSYYFEAIEKTQFSNRYGVTTGNIFLCMLQLIT